MAAYQTTDKEKEKNLKRILKAIEENKNIISFNDIVPFVNIGYTTIFKWYPPQTESYYKIQDALDNNKVILKQELRDKMLESNNAANIIALYKIVGTKEERNALRTQYEAETTGSGDIVLKL